MSLTCPVSLSRFQEVRDDGESMKALQAEKAAKKIIDEVLDKGLAESTWRECYPDAYRDLLMYREDLELSAKKVLVKSGEDRIRRFLGWKR